MIGYILTTVAVLAITYFLYDNNLSSPENPIHLRATMFGEIFNRITTLDETIFWGTLRFIIFNIFLWEYLALIDTSLLNNKFYFLLKNKNLIMTNFAFSFAVLHNSIVALATPHHIF